ncbi:CHASE2 domain-containing protein [Tumidithrix elongata RA019]|uniref:histidine kinase n=1 Tax=Tumidithrix elongata BACA0141 TaxID=2716417 RepID=A0AAW9QBI0_9CYAN|nr:CHASE2 domain-containing protein [Tumidithrix elongata RA019]
MALRKAWQRTALWLGIGWSLLWSLILFDLPLVQQLDLSLQDRFIHLSRPSTTPPEILLVAISDSDLKSWGIDKEPMVYTSLVKRLLDAGASVVVLNLMPNWVQTSDHVNHPIKTLVQENASRIVVVIPTSSASQSNHTEWRSYEYFLPSTDKGNPLFSPRSIVGFSEFEPEAKHPLSSASTARQANLSGEFTLSHNLDLTETLDSATLLSLKKFNSKSQEQIPSLSPIQIRFWGATGTFPRLKAESILSDSPLLAQVRNKIVLIGFTDTSNPDAFAVRSPFDELMPAVELQANLLASLLTNSFYRIVPLWIQNALIVWGGVAIAAWIIYGKLNRNLRRRYRYWLSPVFGLGGFGLLGLLLFSQGWILPVPFPLCVWGATAISVFISLRLGIQKDLIYQQQCEIDRLHNIEQAAILAQAQKTLHRLAANIHQGPLQELKLVMDRLEMLQLNGTASKLDPILDRLANMGQHLRQQLNQTRAISLELTPKLKAGLAAGIEAKLHQLTNSRELTLRVIQDIQPLEEPELNSLWLAAREDIYRFFVEAITNVMLHAQPPHGKATQVKVSLNQQDRYCTLAIENDGSQLAPKTFESPTNLRMQGGYGMKFMATIATELPDGLFECVALTEGGLRVQLSWENAFN